MWRLAWQALPVKRGDAVRVTERLTYWTELVVLLTAPWHEHSTRDVVTRYEARVWAAPQARQRVGDLPPLDDLPPGIEVFVPRGVQEGQVAFWIVAEQTLVVAEFLLGTDRGLQVRPSPSTSDMHDFVESLGELEALTASSG
jgi:hypothetical protein